MTAQQVAYTHIRTAVALRSYIHTEDNTDDFQIYAAEVREKIGMDTHNDVTTVIEHRRSSRVDAPCVLLPPANAFSGFLLVAPDPLCVSKVDSSYQDTSLRKSYAKQLRLLKTVKYRGGEFYLLYLQRHRSKHSLI